MRADLHIQFCVTVFMTFAFTLYLCFEFIYGMYNGQFSNEMMLIFVLDIMFYMIVRYIIFVLLRAFLLVKILFELRVIGINQLYSSKCYFIAGPITSNLKYAFEVICFVKL